PRQGRVDRIAPRPSQRGLCPELFPGWTALGFRGWPAGDDQALGCRHAAGTADLGGYRLRAPRCPMDCRWRRDPRRSAVAVFAGPVLGGNRRGGGEADQRGGAAVNCPRPNANRVIAHEASVPREVDASIEVTI